MRYIISYQQPQKHFVDIEFISSVNADEINVQLPAWRPGRYELANFAKNIQQWAPYDEKGNLLTFQKTTKDSWRVITKGIKELHIKYNYYAAEITAGSTYLDDKQLYMNPVNCCLYIPEQIDTPCEIEMWLPADYKVATSMKRKAINSASTPQGAQMTKANVFEVKNFHELADSPFIASNSLKHNMFVLDGVEFNLWFQGECKPLWPKLINDFFIFINEQFVMMGEYPVDVFHFLFQIVPYRYYHGVEHLSSTVIALGPGCNLMTGDLYNNLLGISSHELYHCWNIKSIRPEEMQPYEYTKENYCRTGYVYEGVTSYYGDMLLFRSGVFSEDEYFKTVNDRLQRHFDNFGRYNLSVADSSFDTWLDGYVAGIPDRKTSIYTEGCITAFMTDILIRKHTKNEKSLDDVMRYLYLEFAKKGKGYSEQDYQGIVEHIANASFSDFFDKYINGTHPYDELLKECLTYLGCELKINLSKKHHEAFYGFKLMDPQSSLKISSIYPGSVCDKAGLSVNDEIVSINSIPVKNDIAEWSEYFGSQPVDLTILSGGTLKTCRLTPGKEEYYKVYYIHKANQPTEQQKIAFNSWSRRKF